MSNFFQSVRQGFGRNSNKSNTQPPSSKTSAGANLQSPSSIPSSPNVPDHHSPRSPSGMPTPSSRPHEHDNTKYFFLERYASLNVKGNFLTLCACPKNVELGEWLAHQVVEQYRLLHGMLQVIQEVNSLTGLPICNEQTCPTMTAGRFTYTWLVNGETAKISAPKFINRVEKWIVSKIHDPVMFPTIPCNVDGPTPAPLTSGNAALQQQSPTSPTPDPAQDWIGKSSGFPQTFYKDCQGMMRQMFRCYAHLYHSHWENPLYHINKHEVLNMCFVHFVTVAKYYKLVPDKEMEPMQPLIDLFVRQEKIPSEALAGHWNQPQSAIQAPPTPSTPATPAPA